MATKGWGGCPGQLTSYCGGREGGRIGEGTERKGPKGKACVSDHGSLRVYAKYQAVSTEGSKNGISRCLERVRQAWRSNRFMAFIHSQIHSCTTDRVCAPCGAGVDDSTLTSRTSTNSATTVKKYSHPSRDPCSALSTDILLVW